MKFCIQVFSLAICVGVIIGGFLLAFFYGLKMLGDFIDEKEPPKSFWVSILLAILCVVIWAWS